jgi:hypothetical protein
MHISDLFWLFFVFSALLTGGNGEELLQSRKRPRFLWLDGGPANLPR